MIDRMIVFTVLLGLLGLSHGLQCPKQKTSPGREVVCYTSVSDAEQLTNAVCRCTTLVHQGYDVRNISTSGFESFQESLKRISPSLQFMISVDDPGKTLMTSGTVRQEIAARLIGILTEVDGVELNMTAGSKERLVHFMKDLKNELKRKSYDKRIFLVLPSKPEDLGKQFELKELSKYVDLFTVPTHYLVEDDADYHTFHPSRLMGLFDMFNADSLIDLINGLGAPKRKTLVSVPASAYKFILKDQDDNAPRSLTEEIQPVIIDQKQLCDLMNKGEWTVERDEDLTAPYAFKNKTWIAFEDKISIAIKGKYALLRNLPGLAIRDIENDFETKCGKPLTHEIHHSFTDFKRKTRAAVLNALEDDLHQTQLSYSTKVRSSEFRVVRVVDTDGNIQAVRENTQTEFTCSRQGYFVHPKSCNRFYRCVKFNQEIEDYSVFEFDCPAGLAFDERTEVCVWPGSLSQGSPCPGSSEIAPVARVRFECPSKPGYYADPQNPRWFFACIDLGGPEMMAYEFRCPFGLIFDEEKFVCEWPWLVRGYSGNGYTSTEYDYRGSDGHSTIGIGGQSTGGIGGHSTVGIGSQSTAGIGGHSTVGSTFGIGGQSTVGTGGYYTGHLPHGYTGTTGFQHGVYSGTTASGTGFSGFSGAAGAGHAGSTIGSHGTFGQGSTGYQGTTGSHAGVGGFHGTVPGGYSVSETTDKTGSIGGSYGGSTGGGSLNTGYVGSTSGVYSGTAGVGYTGSTTGGHGTFGQGSTGYQGTSGSGYSGSPTGSHGTFGQGSTAYHGTSGSGYSGSTTGSHAGAGGYYGTVPGGYSVSESTDETGSNTGYVGSTSGIYSGHAGSAGTKYSGTTGTGQVSSGPGYAGSGGTVHSGTNGIYSGTTGTGYTGSSFTGHGTDSGSRTGTHAGAAGTSYTGYDNKGYTGSTDGVYSGSAGGHSVSTGTTYAGSVTKGYGGSSGGYGGSTGASYTGSPAKGYGGSTGPNYVEMHLGGHGGSTGTTYAGSDTKGYGGSSGGYPGSTGTSYTGSPAKGYGGSTGTTYAGSDTKGYGGSSGGYPGSTGTNYVDSHLGGHGGSAGTTYAGSATKGYGGSTGTSYSRSGTQGYGGSTSGYNASTVTSVGYSGAPSLDDFPGPYENPNTPKTQQTFGTRTSQGPYDHPSETTRRPLYPGQVGVSTTYFGNTGTKGYGQGVASSGTTGYQSGSGYTGGFIGGPATTYHGVSTPTISYGTSGTGTLVTGTNVHGAVITGDSSPGTIVTYGGTPGTVISGSSDQGAIVTGSSYPGYVTTGTGTPGYVVSDGVKTVYHGSSPGTTVYERPATNTDHIGPNAFDGNVSGYTKTSSEGYDNVYSGHTSTRPQDATHIDTSKITLGPSKSPGYSYTAPNVPFKTGMTSSTGTPVAPTEGNVLTATTPTPFLNVEVYKSPKFGSTGTPGIVKTYTEERYQGSAPSGFTRAPVTTVSPLSYTTGSFGGAKHPVATSTGHPVFDTGFNTVSSTPAPVIDHDKFGGNIQDGSTFAQNQFDFGTRITQHGSYRNQDGYGSTTTPSIFGGSSTVPSPDYVSSTSGHGYYDSTSRSSFDQRVTPSGIPKTVQPQTQYLPTDYGSSHYQSSSPAPQVPVRGSTNVGHNRGTTQYVPNQYDVYTSGSSSRDFSKTQTSSSSTFGQNYGHSTPSSVVSYQSTAKPTDVGKAKVIVKWSDLHPLLLGKLGAECTCRGDPFANLRGPGSKLINSSKGKVDLSNYDESEIYVDLEKDVSYENSDESTSIGPVKIWTDETPVSGVSQIQEKPSSVYLPSVTPSANRRVGHTDSSIFYIRGTSPRGFGFRSGKSLSNDGPSVNAVSNGPSTEDDSNRRSTNKIDSGESFHAYGPGGLGDSEEVLDGATNCARPGLFRHPNFCNKFYACHWDEWKKKFTLHVFSCPVHLTFDGGMGACNWPSMGPACQDDNLLV
ncbi:hornerin-like isoform X2 [Colletes gigas]|uniref:hornerin-like isoform X2 n=1 Tax=Colletes gigas TaxID=935657 RepID=UPI001C9AB7C8|nr:hornerin-like isoform X2 [Colletes gigas]